MKRIFLLLLVVGAVATLVYFKYNNSKSIAANQSSSLNTQDKDDGIRDAEEMEFEHTKDVSLGYVPKNRLIDGKVYFYDTDGILTRIAVYKGGKYVGDAVVEE